MNFTDRYTDNSYKINLRAAYGYIKNQNQLKAVIDKSTSIDGLTRLHPTYTKVMIVNLWSKYCSMPYMDIMRQFGMISKGILIKQG